MTLWQYEGRRGRRKTVVHTDAIARQDCYIIHKLHCQRAKSGKQAGFSCMQLRGQDSSNGESMILDHKENNGVNVFEESLER